MTELRPSTGNPATGTLKALRELARAAVGADDATLGKVVAVLDRLEHRGEADLVLEMVRPRLRALGMPRPLNLPRLLFLPMDGGIRAPKEWRRGEASLPRSVLPLLAEAVAARLPPAAQALLPQMERLSTADATEIGRIGGVLWPAAAAALPPLPPAGWAASGLGPADYQAILGLCLPVWAAGPAIWPAIVAAEDGPPEALAKAALAAVVPGGAAPLSIVLATLLAVASAPAQLAHIAALLNPQARSVAVQVLDGLLQAPLPPFESLGIGRATEAALAMARRLEDLLRSPLVGADRLRQVEALRRDAEAACRARYLAGAEQEVVGPAQRLLAAPVVRDAEVLALEAAARGLRGLDAAGRKLGGGQTLDRSVKELVGRLTLLGRGAAQREATQPEGLRPVELVRCIEILAGPEAAATAMAALAQG